MLKIAEFLVEENISCGDILKIYELIIESKFGNRVKGELIYNRFSLEFNFEKEEVILNDDILMEDEPLKLSVKEFFKALKNQEA